MNQFYKIVIVMGIQLILWGLVWYYRPVNKQEVIISEVQEHDHWDVVLECQKIASQTTNDNWGYKGCLEELDEIIKDVVDIRKI